MLALTAAQIQEATGARISGSVPMDAVIEAVTPDSRGAGPGVLFVAKPGEFADGHDYATGAVAAGTPFVLAEREILDAQAEPIPALIVEDAVLAMGDLARAVIERLRSQGVKIAAMTGSAGKTTTKDLTAGILSTLGETVAPIGSYNGEVGVPLTIFNAEESTRYLVLEMGANGVGNIEYLTGIATPDIGVVLNVGTAHAGEFGGVENIAKTKGEMVESLGPQGLAVLNADDPQVWAMRSRTQAPILALTSEDTVTDEALQAQAPGARIVRAQDLRTDENGQPVFTLVADGAQARVESKLIGAHHVTNLLAAAAIALGFGVPVPEIARLLSAQGPGSRWRMERTDRADGVTVINDAYNANPESMRAALRALADLGKTRRTVAVLGDMLELGERSIEEHDAVGRYLVRLNISQLLAVGPNSRATWNGAVMEGSWGEEAHHVPDLAAAEEYLRERLQPGDVVLFKSSNSFNLKELGDRIALDTDNDAAATPAPEPAQAAPSALDHPSKEH